MGDLHSCDESTVFGGEAGDGALVNEIRRDISRQEKERQIYDDDLCRLMLCSLCRL